MHGLLERIDWVFQRNAMQIEKMPVQKPGKDEVLVMVMAVGINYNNVWASQGIPISVIGKDTGYHIGGSDASGIVWAIGDNVKRWKVGDEVIIHCNRDDGDDEECNGGEPMYSNLKGYGDTKQMMAHLLNLQQFSPDNYVKLPLECFFGLSFTTEAGDECLSLGRLRW